MEHDIRCIELNEINLSPPAIAPDLHAERPLSQSCLAAHTMVNLAADDSVNGCDADSSRVSSAVGLYGGLRAER